MKSTLQIVVKGRTKTYAFNFVGDPKHIPEWQSQGLDIEEVLNTVPEWVVSIGLTKPWCRAQDIWRWLRIF